MRLSAIIPIVLAFAAAAGLSYLAAGVAVTWLEERSTEAVAFQLKVEGFDWVEVQSDGLQVVMSGEAQDEADRFKVLSIAGTVVDAARVIDNMSVVDIAPLAPPRFSIEILRNNAGVSLIGLMPASTERAVVLEAAREVAGAGTLTDLLETAEYPEPENWSLALDYAMAALAELPRSKISVDAQRVEVKATANDRDHRRRIEADLTRRAPDVLTVALNITAPRTVITPFTTRFLIDGDGTRFDACTADTEDAQAQILAAAVAAGLDAKAECTLGLGAPSPQWGAATARSIAALAEVGGGTLTLSDVDVSLIAHEGTNAALFDSVAARLESELPDVFTLTAVLPEPPVQGDVGPAEFSVTLSPEGQVQLRGSVPDALARSAIETYAQAQFGSENIYAAIDEADNTPPGWPIRVLAGLEALAELANGSAMVEVDALSVRGNTGNPNARVRIAQILSDKLGEGANFSINVTYSEALDPVANIPTPEECLLRIQDITGQRKITFEPGSAQLDVESLRTVSAIAEVLKECADARIEVAGHTDSQGREEMNLNLSQLRAEAIIAQLQAERVVTTGMVPQGYGETRPIAENDTEEGREANRRIEFTLLSDSEQAADASSDPDSAENENTLQAAPAEEDPANE